MPLSKPAMRDLMRARRAALPAEVRSEAAHALAELFPRGIARAGVKIAAYRAMGAEINPGPLMDRLAGEGARILLPVVRTRGAALCFRDAGDFTRHVPDAAGILAPPAHSPAAIPDIILTPLLAFDRFGGRLGQGGGYYDRTIAVLRSGPGVLAIGLGFAAQESDETPCGQHDEMLDAICTEIGYRRVCLKDPG